VQLDGLLPLRKAVCGEPLLWCDFLKGSSSVAAGLRLRQPEQMVTGSLGDQPTEGALLPARCRSP